ncbi:MAG: hypothetical protein ACRDMU_01370 [Gaiellaceae bacterium]
MANDRLRRQVEDAVPLGRPVPFLCECMDELCMEHVEMTMGDYRHVRASDDTFAVAPGHAASDGEVVVEEREAFHMVRKRSS